MVFFQTEFPRQVAESRIASALACSLGYLLLRDRSMDPPVSGTYKEPPRQCHMLWDEQWILRPRVTNFGTALAVAVVSLAPTLVRRFAVKTLPDLVWRWIR